MTYFWSAAKRSRNDLLVLVEIKLSLNWCAGGHGSNSKIGILGAEEGRQGPRVRAAKGNHRCIQWHGILGENGVAENSNISQCLQRNGRRCIDHVEIHMVP